jgi:hypothetical protein
MREFDWHCVKYTESKITNLPKPNKFVYIFCEANLRNELTDMLCLIIPSITKKDENGQLQFYTGSGELIDIYGEYQLVCWKYKNSSKSDP